MNDEAIAKVLRAMVSVIFISELVLQSVTFTGVGHIASESKHFTSYTTCSVPSNSSSQSTSWCPHFSPRTFSRWVASSMMRFSVTNMSLYAAAGMHTIIDGFRTGTRAARTVRINMAFTSLRIILAKNSTPAVMRCSRTPGCISYACGRHVTQFWAQEMALESAKTCTSFAAIWAFECTQIQAQTPHIH